MTYKEFVEEMYHATQDFVSNYSNIVRDEVAEDASLELLDKIEEILIKEVGKDKAAELLNDLTDTKVKAEEPFLIGNFCAGIRIGYFMSILLTQERTI